MNGMRVMAKFKPKITDTLRPEAFSFIGKTFEFEELWEITEEDGGPYVGQHAWWPVDRTTRFAWVPSEDLEVLYVTQAEWEGVV